MASAADFTDYLLRRARLRAPRSDQAPGEFPAGWQRWFAGMRERPDSVTGAPAAAIVEALARRPLASPPVRSVALGRWQAFNTLWRQDWQPPPREDRRWHWTAVAASGLWHLFFAAMLLWLMYLQYLLPPSQEGETVVQVQYIGTGTPGEPGGGASPGAGGAPAQPQPQPQPASTAGPARLPAVPAVADPAPAEPAPDVPAIPVEARETPEPREQPVAVSAPAPRPEPEVFVLPPVQRLAQPRVTPPELSIPQRPVAAREIPEPVPAPPPVVVDRQLQARPIDIPQPSVALREITIPLPPRPAPVPSIQAIRAPELPDRTPAVAAREMPAIELRPLAGPPEPDRATDTTPAPAAPPTESASPPATRPSATAGAPAATAPGTGPRPAAAPGAMPSPARADDWGDAARDRPGAEQGGPPGLYGNDGRVRLADGPGSASPGRPPGVVTQEIANLDRAGTWLKRRPNDYEPTMFDRVWRPNETLLQEWVRKSIQQVTIPIPGTSKRIVCNVAVLAFGGGCDISDPNLNDQPASARPPPDIPFKPGLQEDNGSVRAPGARAQPPPAG